MTAGLPALVTNVCGYAHHIERAGAGMVLQSPFNQATLNTALQKMLSTPEAQWQQGGVNYTQTILKQSSPTIEADLLARFAKDNSQKIK